jgi:hypothetical protein
MEGQFRQAMITVLIDHDIEGQAERLAETISKGGWAQAFSIRFVRFMAVGLPHNSPDRAVWRFAQAHRMFLLTGNRNKEDESSLEQTITDENTLTSLPVITVADPDGLYEKDCREDCADRLLDIVLYPQNYLGTGRQYIP